MTQKFIDDSWTPAIPPHTRGSTLHSAYLAQAERQAVRLSAPTKVFLTRTTQPAGTLQTHCLAHPPPPGTACPRVNDFIGLSGGRLAHYVRNYGGMTHEVAQYVAIKWLYPRVHAFMLSEQGCDVTRANLIARLIASQPGVLDVIAHTDHIGTDQALTTHIFNANERLQALCSNQCGFVCTQTRLCRRPLLLLRSMLHQAMRA
jgi:hypothetical protein